MAMGTMPTGTHTETPVMALGMVGSEATTLWGRPCTAVMEAA